MGLSFHISNVGHLIRADTSEPSSLEPIGPEGNHHEGRPPLTHSPALSH